MVRIIAVWERAIPGPGDKSPFIARGDKRAVLCLHGFTGTPFEVRPVAEGLARRGLSVSAPVLAGHCGSLDELAATRWPDWFASAERALVQLSEEIGGAPVGVLGFSMGGLLALRLAHLHPDRIAALAVLSVPLRMPAAQVVAARMLSRLPSAMLPRTIRFLPKRLGFDVTDKQMRQLNPGQPAVPLRAAASLFELGRVVRRDLPSIRLPTLVAHGVRDRTVPFDDSLELAGSLASDEVERVWLPQSGHLVALDVERATLIDAVMRFFIKHLPGKRPGDAPSAASREAS